MRRYYKEGAVPFSQLPQLVASVAKGLKGMDMWGYFEACGYGVAGTFESSRAWSDAVDVTCRGGEPFDAEELAEGDANILLDGGDGDGEENEGI